MRKGIESYEFIGHFAIALYTQRIKIRLSALQKVLNDKGANYGGGISMGKALSAAYNHWKERDWAIHHAIAASFTGSHDEYLFE